MLDITMQKLRKGRSQFLAILITILLDFFLQHEVVIIQTGKIIRISSWIIVTIGGIIAVFDVGVGTTAIVIVIASIGWTILSIVTALLEFETFVHAILDVHLRKGNFDLVRYTHVKSTRLMDQYLAILHLAPSLVHLHDHPPRNFMLILVLVELQPLNEEEMDEIGNMFELYPIVSPLHIFLLSTFDLHLLDRREVAHVVAVTRERTARESYGRFLLLEAVDHRFDLLGGRDGNHLFAGIVLRIDVITQIDVKTIVAMPLIRILLTPIIVQIVIVEVSEGRPLLLALSKPLVEVSEEDHHKIVEIRLQRLLSTHQSSLLAPHCQHFLLDAVEFLQQLLGIVRLADYTVVHVVKYIHGGIELVRERMIHFFIAFFEKSIFVKRGVDSELDGVGSNWKGLGAEGGVWVGVSEGSEAQKRSVIIAAVCNLAVTVDVC